MNMDFRYTSWSFTPGVCESGLRCVVPTRPRFRPYMTFLFVASYLCLKTSFPPRLTTTQLSLTSGFLTQILQHRKVILRLGLPIAPKLVRDESPNKFMPRAGRTQENAGDSQ